MSNKKFFYSAPRTEFSGTDVESLLCVSGNMSESYSEYDHTEIFDGE